MFKNSVVQPEHIVIAFWLNFMNFIFWGAGIKPNASLSKCSATELPSQPTSFL
jgi:hypothetical protein